MMLEPGKIKVDALRGATKKIVMMQAQPEAMQEIREAAAAVSQAEDEESKGEAQERLEQLLDDYFDEDMKRREDELDQVEQRVKKLRDLLQRRREKRREIVDLQVQVLLNEADGLGFFGAEGGGAQQPYLFSTQPAPAVAFPPGVPRLPEVPGAPPAPAVEPVPVAPPRQR
jgi:hypothetical protein